jgi:hypothetical protein
MIYARQSTAIIVTVGPCLDADGVADTGVVVGAFLISKNGGAPAALNGSATLTHRNTGNYSLSLTTTDTNTVGTVELVLNDTVTACPIKEIQVVEEAAYDVLFAASAPGPASPTNITAGTITTATNVTTVNGLAANVITATSINNDAITAAKIANNAIDAATFAADVDAEVLSYIVDDATRIDASALNTAAVTTVPAILADTNELQTDWANGGRLDNILDARSSQTSVDDLPTNAELAAALGTADDATLAAIAALHDFDPATDEVTANVAKVNGVTIVGDGSATPFNV